MSFAIPSNRRSELTPELLAAAYSRGLFPMARSRRSSVLEWYCPDPRAVLPLEGLRCPRSLQQAIRRGDFQVRSDTAFEQVIRACAEPRARQHQTWINDAIIHAYTALHQRGLAHSVEAWRQGQLVGGLYGVSLGGAFFGESMFSRPQLGGSNASKVCLAWLVDHLRRRGYTLLDVQINSDHMKQFGAVDIPLGAYMQKLETALTLDTSW